MIAYIPKLFSVKINEPSGPFWVSEFNKIFIDVATALLKLMIFANEFWPILRLNIEPLRNIGLEFTFESREIF